MGLTDQHMPTGQHKVAQGLQLRIHRINPRFEGLGPLPVNGGQLAYHLRIVIGHVRTHRKQMRLHLQQAPLQLRKVGRLVAQ